MTVVCYECGESAVVNCEVCGRGACNSHSDNNIPFFGRKYLCSEHAEEYRDVDGRHERILAELQKYVDEVIRIEKVMSEMSGKAPRLYGEYEKTRAQVREFLGNHDTYYLVDNGSWQVLSGINYLGKIGVDVSGGVAFFSRKHTNSIEKFLRSVLKNPPDKF